MTHWLGVLAVVSLGTGFLAAGVIVIDLIRNGQKMWIMDIVWPVTALWAGPLGLWGYFRYGRASSKRHDLDARRHAEMSPSQAQPFSVLTAKGTLHCGSGCTLGDIIAEWLILLVPFSVFGQQMFGAWVYDYILAFSLGIAFQYFTIKPMKGLSRKDGLVAAVKADALSLTAWQVGMYGWMAVVRYAIFGRELQKTDPVFWFMMQVAMCFGFLTSFPVNWWLLRSGIKEKM